MRCPKDKQAMKTMTAYRVTLDYCPNCYGIWFDKEEFIKVIHAIVYANAEVGDSFKKWEKVEDDGSTLESFREEDDALCPRGHGAMEKASYGGDSDVHMDVCKECGGFYLDGDELAKLFDYARPNEYDFAVGRFLIREKKEIDDTLKQIETLPARFANFVASMFVSPHLAVVLIISLLGRLVQNDVAKLMREYDI